MSHLQHTDDVSDKQVDERAVLRLLPIPKLSKHTSLQVRRQTNSGSSTGDDGSQEASNPSIVEQDSEVGALGRLWGSVRRFLDASAGGIRAGRGQEVQHQPVGGGDGHDRKDEGSEGAQVKPDAAATCLASCDDPKSSTVREPLSRQEIHERIKEGNHRRAQLKKGVIRRCLGNIRNIVAATCLMTAAIGVATAQLGRCVSANRPDCLEIFAGKAEVSCQFAQWGWNTMEPIDQIHGTDLSVVENRERVKRWIRKYRPRLVIVSYPCKVWSPIMNIAYNTPQARRSLRVRRLRERPFLEFCEEIFQLQLENGGDALGENPLRSASFDEPPIKRILTDPRVYSCVGHGCQYGIVHAISKKPLLKPTVWFSTAAEICDELSKKCPRDHEHDQCLGGSRITEHAGKYTVEIAKAIHRGFIRVLKRKEPGRIRIMLRKISSLLRKGGPKEGLRWNEKQLKNAIDRWSAVYVAENQPLQDLDAASIEGQPSRSVADDAMTGGSAQVEKKLHGDGISFKVPPGRKLSEPVKQALKRIHCNLGHPSKADLERFLKLGGVTGEILEALNWMECVTCAHGTKPKTHRNASIPPSQVVFGDEVQLDLFKIHDAGAEGHWFLSILDRATSFHVIKYVPDHAPKTIHDVFHEGWIQWAGPPSLMTVDMEGGFRSREFWEDVSNHGTTVISIAGTAHWQAGKVERHNQIIKEILRNVIKHVGAKGSEHVRKVAAEAVRAKNSLVREHGWSPVALVFGREPRLSGELYEDGNPVAYHPNVGTQGSDVADRMRYRYFAKMEYVKAQAKFMLQRTVRCRTRKLPKIPEVGQLVFFWRDTHKTKIQGTRWQGPGCVVGHQGSNVWVSCGGRCFLVAGEHLRETVGDEKFYGDPMIQKDLALFRKVPEETTYEDLTKQNGPEDDGDEITVDVESFVNETPQTDDQPQNTPPEIPKDILKAASGFGWTRDDYGNPTHICRKAWAFKIPTPVWDGEMLPLRTSWVFARGRWKRLEKEVSWGSLKEPCGRIPDGPVDFLVTVFASRARKVENPPWLASKKLKTEEDSAHTVMMTQTASSNKLKKMLDKEVPYEKISPDDWPAYEAAIQKEWNSWVEYDSCQILTLEESSKVEREQPKRILPSRFVLRNKHAGLVDPAGKALPLKAKARLCLAGHMCPDSLSGELQVDSPTVERITTMMFLNNVICNDWVQDWYIGDISNAFLQGAPIQGKDMFMRQPKQGLPGLQPGQILKLIKSVYGRPDAPRAWYDELARVLENELCFKRSAVDGALFHLRDPKSNAVCASLIVHVDDLMVAGNGSEYARKMIEKLHKRFPFGTWQKVADEEAGVTYCGKEIKYNRASDPYTSLSQHGFVEGRLDPINISRERASQSDERASDSELTDYRSAVGSLQWLATQSRPDIAFEVNQMQKRVKDLRVHDLIRANKCIKEVKADRQQLKFYNLGETEIVVYHDASLFNSVGVEISDREADDILLTGKEKKLVYSQKGVLIGLVKKGSMEEHGPVKMNVLDWKSTTNKRVIESSLSAETHAAIHAHGLGRFLQALLAEVTFGSEVIGYLDDEDWQALTPMNMITDCKSIYDHVKKDGQHLSDKGSVVQVILLRKMCSVRPHPGKARLWWVPTRHQLADALTKSGKGKVLREQLGSARFHEAAVPKRKTFQSKENSTSVKVSGIS